MKKSRLEEIPSFVLTLALIGEVAIGPEDVLTRDRNDLVKGFAWRGMARI